MAVLNFADGLTVLDRRTRVVRLAIFFYIAVSLANMLAVAAEMTGVVNKDATELTSTESLAGLVQLLSALTLFATAILVAMWIYRAHANLRAIGAPDLQFTPGWAVGWYFIPFANLVKPFQAMRELWAQSLAQHDSYGDEADPQLKIWWGTWIAGNIASNLGLRLQSSADADTVSAGYVVDLASTGALIAASWFLLRIMTTINAAQRGGNTMTHAFT